MRTPALVLACCSLLLLPARASAQQLVEPLVSARGEASPAPARDLVVASPFTRPLQPLIPMDPPGRDRGRCPGPKLALSAVAGAATGVISAVILGALFKPGGSTQPRATVEGAAYLAVVGAVGLTTWSSLQGSDC
jgi:hypothetical protein